MYNTFRLWYTLIHYYENIYNTAIMTLKIWKQLSIYFKTLCTSGAWVESSCYLISPESISLRNLWHLAMRILMASVTRTSGARMPVDSTETGGEGDTGKGWVWDNGNQNQEPPAATCHNSVHSHRQTHALGTKVQHVKETCDALRRLTSLDWCQTAC